MFSASALGNFSPVKVFYHVLIDIHVWEEIDAGTPCRLLTNEMKLLRPRCDFCTVNAMVPLRRSKKLTHAVSTFPEPLAPIITTTALGATSRLMLSSTFSFPYHLLRDLILIIVFVPFTLATMVSKAGQAR